MTILDVLKVPNPVLSQFCDNVINFDDDLKVLINDMFETMKEHQGVGLAAPQVGILSQLFICKTDEGEVVAINPRLEYHGDEYESEEACLSIPKISALVTRYKKVTLHAQDINGISFTKTYDTFLAIVIQHEYDHLQGKLITDEALEVKTIEEES